jgi:hypothetical protein
VFTVRWDLPFTHLLPAFDAYPGFDPGPVRLGFMVDKVAQGKVLRVLWFPRVNNIPPVFRTHRHQHVALNGRTNGRSVEAFKKQCLSLIGDYWIEKYTNFFFTLKVSKVSF